MTDTAIDHMLQLLSPLALSREIKQPYHNCRLATVNDHEVRLSVMTSGFQWHRHPESDESFLVLEGELVIAFEDREITLKPGDFLTVPKGVRHCTRPGGERSVNLTFEKTDTETIFG